MNPFELLVLILYFGSFLVISYFWPFFSLIISLYAMQFGEVVKLEIAGKHALISLTDIGIILLFVPVGIKMLKNPMPQPGRRLCAWWGIYLVCLVPSLIFADDLLRWLAGFRILIQDLLVFVICFYIIKSYQRVYRICDALIAWACLAVTTLCYNVFFGENDYITIMMKKETDVAFARSNYLASFLLLILPLSANLYYNEKTRWKKWMYGISSIMMIGGIFLTKSRGAMIVLVIYLIIQLFWKMHNRFIAKISLLLLLIIFYIIVDKNLPSIIGNIDESIPEVSEMSSDPQFISRALIWKHQLSAFVENPIFGKGLMNTMTPSYEYYGTNNDALAHNYILQVLSETGIIGFLGFASFWTTIIIFLNKSAKLFNSGEKKHVLITGAIAGIGNAFAHGLVENNILTKEYGIVLWIIIGIMYAMIGMAKRKHTKVIRPL
jgi:O-antigen ligase